MKLLQVVNHLEQVGDIIETNLVKIGRQRIEEGVVVSEPTQAIIGRYHREVTRAFQGALKAICEEDTGTALVVKGMKPQMAELAEETARHEVERLIVNAPNRLQTFTREMEIIENLSRIYRLCRKIARLQWVEEATPKLPQAAE
jgi:phosphate:Na+ symporter